MARSHYVFGYEAEPADERPTDYGTTNFGQSGLVALSTAPAPWTVSQHSTFDEPSRVFERVQAHRQRKRLQLRLVAWLAALAAVGAGAAALVMRW